MSEQYTVVFKGEVMAGKNPEQVKERLKSALKTDDKGVSRLFSGNLVAVRQRTDLATAEKYQKVFADLITERAAGLIVAHNHPSGDLTPSREDRAVTIRLKEAAAILGIPLMDHIIFHTKGYYSFAAHDEL